MPTLVLWGEADRIGDVEYGRAYAAAIPGAQLTLLAKTGHMPQVETPEAILRPDLGLRGHPRPPRLNRSNQSESFASASAYVPSSCTSSSSKLASCLAVSGANDSVNTRSDDLVAGATQLAPLVGQPVTNRAPGPGHALDEAALDHASGERSERLIALKRQLREVVQRGAGVFVEVSQRVPLHDADVEPRQPRVQRTMMPHLEPLHRQADVAQDSRHRAI